MWGVELLDLKVQESGGSCLWFFWVKEVDL